MHQLTVNVEGGSDLAPINIYKQGRAQPISGEVEGSNLSIFTVMLPKTGNAALQLLLRRMDL